MKKTISHTTLLPALAAFISVFTWQAFTGQTFAGQTQADNHPLIIEDAWIAEAPPVSKVMVAYMSIKNTGSEDLEIIHAESDVYSSIEFHETIHEDDMARMVRHDSLQIDAGSKLELRRGGPHLMLFNPVRRLTAGDTVDIELTLYNRQTFTITVPVKRAHN